MEKQRRQLFALVEAMNDALDKQRWRRLPAFHQQLMRQFHDYAAAETDAAQLDAVKAQLYGAFNALIKRREQRRSVEARMEQHQRHQEGVLACSIGGTFGEVMNPALLRTLGTLAETASLKADILPPVSGENAPVFTLPKMVVAAVAERVHSAKTSQQQATRPQENDPVAMQSA